MDVVKELVENDSSVKEFGAYPLQTLPVLPYSDEAVRAFCKPPKYHALAESCTGLNAIHAFVPESEALSIAFLFALAEVADMMNLVLLLPRRQWLRHGMGCGQAKKSRALQGLSCPREDLSWHVRCARGIENSVKASSCSDHVALVELAKRSQGWPGRCGLVLSEAATLSHV